MSEIAVIGMGGRFPGAQNLSEFWMNLHSGIDSISMLTENRLGFDQVDLNMKFGGFIPHLEEFKPEFFGLSQREAKKMDPQQKIMLEVSWEALVDAGMQPQKMIRSATGVFIGVMGSEWGRISFSDLSEIDAHTGTGNGYCMIANRLSYLYNFSGPSMAIDTACSSSLVALDLAMHSLLREEIDTALVGGVNLILSPALSVFYQKAGLASLEGRCKPFGSDSSGIARGEGAGALILKNLDRALRDQDRIYAVLKASSVNQNGLGSGVTAPNRWAQIELIQNSLIKSGFSACDIQYVEAHGTGTLMGDRIEAAALSSVYAGAERSSPLYIGSVKSNIGHLEGAAGVAALIKVALSLYYENIPPSLHFGDGNPLIDFQGLGLAIPQLNIPWLDPVRRAGVSSFGLGGTNVHLILENFQAKARQGEGKHPPSSWIQGTFSEERANFQLNLKDENEARYHEAASRSDQNPESESEMLFYEAEADSEKDPEAEGKTACHDAGQAAFLNLNLLEKAVCSIVASVLECPAEAVHLEAHFIHALGLDSFLMLDLKNELEQSLSLVGKMSVEVMMELNTVSDLIAYLARLGPFVLKEIPPFS